MASTSAAPVTAAQSDQGMGRIVFAAAAGTMIEWYDFYIFGSLATTIAPKFYQTGTPLGDLIAWLAAFAIGFIVRPLGSSTPCTTTSATACPAAWRPSSA